MKHNRNLYFVVIGPTTNRHSEYSSDDW
uniref:Uncharacterized protein n=1 Tax=Arundo donax TaxID=35708 RepID=A0A0A9AG52_ARUDO